MANLAETDTNDIVQAMVAQRLRRFLLVLSGLIFIGTMVELWLAGHFENAIQLIPFILSGLGVLATATTLARPQQLILKILRVIMILIFIGSLFGIYEHLEHNLEFALEIQPTLTLATVFFDALSGANPLLAPGILALGAILALAATYYHPTFALKT